MTGRAPGNESLPARNRSQKDEANLALIVDDLPIDRLLAGNLLRSAGLRLAFAENGKDALDQIDAEPPAIVVTDLQMPAMDGLALVERIRCDHPSIPVVLMTALGSEDIAAAALRAGAANYVPKRALAQLLPDIIASVLAAAKTDRRRQRLLECTHRLDYDLALPNDPALIPLLVAQFQEQILRIGLCDLNSKIRVGIALEEALLNGIYHGNLEVSSDLKQKGTDEFWRVAAERAETEPYASRRLHVGARLALDEAMFVIRDEGNGFDPGQLADPTNPENLLKASGRGLLLIRTFMDEVSHNENGNQITMIKRRGRPK
jgi:CheY-like chemotaxis protein